MKEKIAQALKTKYATLGLSQKAFDGVAAYLEKTVTKEEDIEAAISADGVSNLLKAFQGESDSLRTAKLKAEKDLEDYKKAHPDTKPTETKEEPKADDALAAKIAALEAKQAEYEKKAQEADKAAKHKAIIDALSDKLKEKGCTNDFIRETTLSGIVLKDEDTAESLVEAYEAKYNETFKRAYGEGVTPPRGGEVPKEYKAGSFSSEVERLRAEGKLPAAK